MRREDNAVEYDSVIAHTQTRPLVSLSLSLQAYDAWRASNNLRDLVSRLTKDGEHALDHKATLGRELSVRASLMTPVKPMLAEACKSYEKAVQKVSAMAGSQPNSILGGV